MLHSSCLYTPAHFGYVYVNEGFSTVTLEQSKDFEEAIAMDPQIAPNTRAPSSISMMEISDFPMDIEAAGTEYPTRAFVGN